jgi:hypothetical protein
MWGSPAEIISKMRSGLSFAVKKIELIKFYFTFRFTHTRVTEEPKLSCYQLKLSVVDHSWQADDHQKSALLTGGHIDRFQLL